MESGQRFEKCELSTIDTTFLLAGALTAAQYFQREDPDDVLLNLDVQFEPGLGSAELAAVVDRLEKAIHARYTEVKRIFIEAELFTDSTQGIVPGKAPGNSTGTEQ